MEVRDGPPSPCEKSGSSSQESQFILKLLTESIKKLMEIDEHAEWLVLKRLERRAEKITQPFD